MADGRNLIDQLNRSMPVATAMALGQLLEDIVQHQATLEVQLAAMAVKLNTSAAAGTGYLPIVPPASIAGVTFTPAASQATAVTPPSLR
jgi:hypothetical protein